MSFLDFNEVVTPLELSYKGKAYRLSMVRMSDAAKVRAVTDPDAEVDADEVERILLGDALDDMIADDVPAGFRGRAFLTALAEFRGGRTEAEAIWATAGEPGAVAAWIADRAEPEAAPA